MCTGSTARFCFVSDVLTCGKGHVRRDVAMYARRPPTHPVPVSPLDTCHTLSGTGSPAALSVHRPAREDEARTCCFAGKSRSSYAHSRGTLPSHTSRSTFREPRADFRAPQPLVMTLDAPTSTPTRIEHNILYANHM